MKQTLLKTMLLLLITVTMINCNKDDVNETLTNEIQEIKNAFTLEYFDDNHIKNNLNVNWFDFKLNINEDNNDTKIFEFDTYLKKKVTIENDFGQFDHKYKVIAFKDNLNAWSFELIKFFASDEKSTNHLSFLTPNLFSGTLYYYNLSGETLRIEGYVEGKLINVINTDKINNKNLHSKIPPIPTKKPKDSPTGPVGGGSGGNGGSGKFVAVYTDHYTDWYKVTSDGIEYTHSVFNYRTVEYIFVGNSIDVNSNINYHIHSAGNSLNSGSSESNNHSRENINKVDRIFIETSSTPQITNIKNELKCYDKSKSAKLTIYAEQAVKNSREVTARLGHTFIGLEQNGIIRNIGFYPDNGGIANLVSNQDSEIHDNSESPYHISITVDISSSQLTSIINYIENYPVKYDLNNYNCTDFGIGVASHVGFIPILI